MGIEIKVNLSSRQAIMAALDRIPKKSAGKNVLRRAIRKSLNSVLGEIRGAITSGIPSMKAEAKARYAKSIRIDRVASDIGGNVTGFIRAADKRDKGGTNWSKLAHLFEDGVKPHKINQPKAKRTLSHPGIAGSGEWAKTWDKLSPKMQGDFAGVVFAEIEKEWAKI